LNNHENSALLIIDLQKDFCPGGALAVSSGDEIVSGINILIQESKFKKIVLTADWHPNGHVSFASAHNPEHDAAVETGEELPSLWPDHCVEGSDGAKFHTNLDVQKADLIIRKGRNVEMDSYSAFFENDRITATGLRGYLTDHDIKNVYICGLALDWCVFFSAMDAVKHGFETYVIIDFTRSIDLPAGYAFEKENEMKQAGINIIDSSNL
jgi:nicotinamidase/pyrazinamidase